MSNIQNGDLVLQHTGGVSGFVSFNAVLPRTKSGLVVLSNTEHISATPLRATLFNLLIKDIEEQDKPEIPEVAGPEPKQVVLEFFQQMRAGNIDRSKLGDEFNFYLTDEKIDSRPAAAAGLGRTGQGGSRRAGRARRHAGRPSHTHVQDGEATRVALSFPQWQDRAIAFLRRIADHRSGLHLLRGLHSNVVRH